MTIRQFKCHHISGYPMTVQFQDLGDSQPVYDKDGNCFEAYTTWFCVDGRSVKSIVARVYAERVGDVGRVRLAEDMRLLKEEFGVNPDTFEFDSIEDVP